nr:tetratricopeptide repeat protein [Sebaldella sp.]
MKKIIIFVFIFLAFNYSSFSNYSEEESNYLEKIKENDSEAMNSLGVLYYNQEKYELAEKYYLMAIKENDSEAMN